MRAFTLALALTLPIGLAACADSPTEEAYEEGAPVGDRADVIGDGEIIDEPGEPDADVLGDGFATYDVDTDGFISEDEYNTGIGDADFGTYDVNADGMLDETEYSVYETNRMNM